MPVESARECIIRVPESITGEDLEAFLRNIRRSIASKSKEITLDCSALEYASPGHISTIWRAHVDCVHAGVPVNVSSVKRNLKRILKALDLHDYLIREDESVLLESIEGIEAQLNHHSPKLQVKFWPTAEDVNHVMAELNTHFANSGVSEIESFELQTVFYEIATNIRLHSRNGEGSAAWLELFNLDDSLILKFVDEGPPFDPTQEEARFDPEEAIKNGQNRKIGLALVKRLVNAIHYERENGRLNVLYLKKRFLTRTGTKQ